MAVMYSKLEGCLDETTKLDPLGRTDLLHLSQRFAGQVNNPLKVRFLHGRILGVVCPTVVGGSVASLWARATCLGSSTVLLGSLECPKSNWVPVTPAWLATCLLNIVASGGIAPASWEPTLLVAWEVALLGGEAPLAWETWGILLSVWEALSLDEHLTAWEEALLTRETSLSTWEIALSDQEAWEALSLAEHLTALEESWEIALLALPSLEGMLLRWTTLASWEIVLSWGRRFPFCLGRNWVITCLRPVTA